MKIDPTGRCGLMDMAVAPKGAHDAIFAVNDNGDVVGPLFYWDEATIWTGQVHYSADDGESPAMPATDLIGWTTSLEFAEAAREQLMVLWGETA